MKASLIGSGPVTFDPIFFSYCNTLWENRDWIYRRVDLLKTRSQDMVDMKYSLDISGEQFISILKEHGASNYPRVPIPITMRDHAPFLDIDLNLNGSPQSLAGRSDVSRFMQAIFFHRYIQECCLGFKLLRQNFEFLSKILYAFILGNMADWKSGLDDLARSIETSSDNKALVKRRLIALGDFTARVKEFGALIGVPSGHYIVVANIDTPKDATNFKISLSQRLPYHTPITHSFRPWKNVVMHYLASPLGTDFGTRYHFKLSVPYEFWVRKIEVEDHSVHFFTTGQFLSHSGEGDVTKILKFSSSRELTEKHDLSDQNSKIRPLDTNIHITLGLRFHVFHLKAFLILLLLSVFSVASMYQPAFNEETDPANYLSLILAGVALLLAFPTIFGNSDESRLARSTLLRYRILFATTTLITVSFALCYQLFSEPDRYEAIFVLSFWSVSAGDALAFVSFFTPLVTASLIALFGIYYRYPIVKYYSARIAEWLRIKGATVNVNSAAPSTVE